MTPTTKKPPIKYTYYPERGPNGTFEIEPAMLAQMMERMRTIGASK